MANNKRIAQRVAKMRRAEFLQENPDLIRIVERNIRRITQLRRIAEESRSLQEKVADVITTFSGSMLFVYLHALLFAVWIGLNLSVPKFKALDPFPFPFLTLVVSLEAIFLSTFVLVSQNRMQATSDDRDDLDLQVDLLAEYEITRMLRLIRQMADKMGIEEAEDPELDALGHPIKPQHILQEIESRSSQSGGHPRPTTDVGDNKRA